MDSTVAQDSCTRVSELTIEHFAIENEELRETLRERERDYCQLQAALHSSLDLCRKLLREKSELREQIDRWQRDASKARKSAAPWSH